MAEWLREMSVGEWYEAGGEPFEIIGIEARAGVVLVQHFDGALEEFDFDSWLELNARPCAAPESCAGALDMDDPDGDDDERLCRGHRGVGNPLDEIEARGDDY